MDGRVDARIKKGLRGQNGSEQASLLNTYRTSTTRQQHKRNLRMKKAVDFCYFVRNALCNEWLKKINLSNKIRFPQTQI